MMATQWVQLGERGARGRDAHVHAANTPRSELLPLDEAGRGIRWYHRGGGGGGRSQGTNERQSEALIKGRGRGTSGESGGAGDHGDGLTGPTGEKKIKRGFAHWSTEKQH